MTSDTAEAPADAEGGPLVARVFAKLADGEFHSGEDLAWQLAVSRSAIWKATSALRELGATIHAVRNRGYRLARSGEPLDAHRIRELLTRVANARVRSLDVAWSVGSTNTVLMERTNPPPGDCEALLAEYQTAGRGRRGRAWLAPPGGSICLSLSWTFPHVPRDLGALGLVIGVCALRGLVALGVENVRLKWPNDLLVADRKLGGVLIELRAESGGPACVVIGIGLNVALGTELLARIAEMGLQPMDLVSAGLSDPSRNAVAAGLISSFVQGLEEFGQAGVKPFIEEWSAADALSGRPVTVESGEGAVPGIARGIDINGALMVETPQGVRKFISGDVSVRATT
jgi:BirA family biotin operon repressor/biotin-[acetyl-CoA-carboxylase] ligase